MKPFAPLALVPLIFALTFDVSLAFADRPSSITAQGPKAEMPKKSKPPFTISKETTYLTEPLTPDGYVDYVAAINKMCSEGVTAENNAVVLLLEAVGPSGIKEERRYQYYRMLGIAPLPEKGEYLISYETFLKKTQSKQGNADETQADQEHRQEQEKIDKFYNSMEAPWTATEYPHLAQWLKANQKPLDEIHEAVQRPRFYAPLISDDSYAPVINATLEIVQQPRPCARLLMAHAMYSIGEGKIEDARRDILACHRLARLVGQGPTFVETLVAIALDGIACRGDVTLAQSGKLTAREAADFIAELKKLPPMPKMTDKFDKIERLIMLDCIAILAKKGPRPLATLMGIGDQKDGPLKELLAMNFPSAFDWDVVLRMGNRWYDHVAEAGRKPTWAERIKAWKEIEEKTKKLAEESNSLRGVKDSLMAGAPVRTITSKKLVGVFLGHLTPALGAAGQAEERSYVYSDLSQIALALGAYLSDNGRYPDRLAELTPKYLPELPKDRFTDTDYVYQCEGNGYLLYSVGANGKDDGGKSRSNDPPDDEGDDFLIRTPKEAK